MRRPPWGRGPTSLTIALASLSRKAREWILGHPTVPGNWATALGRGRCASPHPGPSRWRGRPAPVTLGWRAPATCEVAGPGAGWGLMVTAMDSTAEPSATEAFYDARRDVYYTKPALRGWLHLLWFEVSLVFGTLLLAQAHGVTRITASAIYAASVSGMFGASALYHRGNWS